MNILSCEMVNVIVLIDYWKVIVSPSNFMTFSSLRYMFFSMFSRMNLQTLISYPIKVQCDAWRYWIQIEFVDSLFLITSTAFTLY